MLNLLRAFGSGIAFFHLRILVAEDHPLNQVTLREQLERLGCEVTLADDGEEGAGTMGYESV